MIIGVPKEIKTREYRVGMTPAGVRSLTSRGHKVLVEHDAGDGSGIRDAEYDAQGARIVPAAADAWGAELVVKVKEPLPGEYGFFRKGLILYTYLHLATEPELTRALARAGVAGVAYETIELEDGDLAAPSPDERGRGAHGRAGRRDVPREGARRQGRAARRRPGTRRGRVVILGGGVVGRNAATIAVGMGAQVTVLDVRADTMAYLEDVFGGAIETLYSNPTNIEEMRARADLVIGAVLVTGAAAPKLVTEALVAKMSTGSVIVDVAVDQGGCIETCRPTTHDHPTYEVRRRRALLRPQHAGRRAPDEHLGAHERDHPLRREDRRPGARRRGAERHRAPPGHQHRTAGTSPTSRSRRRTGWTAYRRAI